MTPEAAAHDLERVHKLLSGNAATSDRLVLSASESVDDRHRVWFKIFTVGKPLTLSDALPVLENMGVRVLNERPYELRLSDDRRVWIQNFELSIEPVTIEADSLAERFAECFDSVVTAGPRTTTSISSWPRRASTSAKRC